MTEVFHVPLRNTGMERTLNKIQHTKLILEKKIIPPLLPGFESAYQQAIPATFTTTQATLTAAETLVS